MGKITSFKGQFESMRAFLHHIAEDDDAVAFIGCVIRKDGAIVPIHFKATREQMAYAAALWLRGTLDGEDQ